MAPLAPIYIGRCAHSPLSLDRVTVRRTIANMKFLFALVALFALQGCMAKPSGDATDFDLSNTLESLQKMAKKIGEQFGLDNVDADSVKTTINDNTAKLISELQTFGNKMKTEIDSHEGEINAKVKEMQEQLHNVQTTLKNAAGEDATKKADEIKKDFETAYTDTVSKLQSFFKSHESEVNGLQENVKKYSESLMQHVLKIGQDVQKKVNEVADAHDKTHE